MKADSFKLAKVFSSGGEIHYMLPHFQREYAWDRAEWETLFNDACAIHDELSVSLESDQITQDIEHFLGSLVVVNAGTVSGTMTAFKLVDGQQRLTTISLFFCALKRIVLQENPALARKIARLLINEDEEGDHRFKLLPTTKYGDREAYKAIVDGDTPPDNESRIPRAFEFLSYQLKHKVERGDIQPERLFFVLTNSFQVVFIELTQSENPYKIFESLNAKGKALSQADLVRNYIAMCLPASTQESVFCNHWAKIEELLQEKRMVGHSGIGELTAFLRHYLTMRTHVLCNERHVYARFRDYMNRDFSMPSAFVDEIKQLHRFAVLYDHLLRPNKQPIASVREAMKRLETLEISTAYPFLLAASNACSTGEVTADDFAKVLGLLENYLMRRFLAEEPTNYLNKMFPQLWNEIKPDTFLESLEAALVERKYPSDNRIRQKMLTRPLYYKKDSTRKQVGFLLEQINRQLSIGTGGYTVLDESATIEHILPQNPSEAWKTELGSDFARFEEFVHTLGNLTLVTQEWNSSLSNASFETKKTKLAAHALRLNSDYFSQYIPHWNEMAIQVRSNYLIDRILQIWPRNSGHTRDDEAAIQETASFHPQVIEAVSIHLGVVLIKQKQTQYGSVDGTVRVTCAVSKAYHARANISEYWFRFDKSHREFLEQAENGYAAFGCGSAHIVVLFPFATLLPLTANMPKTESGNTDYWHVTIYEKNNKILLAQRGLDGHLDISQYQIYGCK